MPLEQPSLGAGGLQVEESQERGQESVISEGGWGEVSAENKARTEAWWLHLMIHSSEGLAVDILGRRDPGDQMGEMEISRCRSQW